MRKLQKIQALANHELSNYDGSFDEYNQFDGSGSALDFVDFDGTEPAPALFPQEVEQSRAGSRRMVQITVTNPHATLSKDFFLSNGLDPNLVGTILKDDAALVPVGGADTIVVKGNLKDIKFFRNFFLTNPCRVLGFKVAATTTQQIETNVSIEVDTPFYASLKSRQIVLADYQNENTFRDKMVTVPEGFQLDSLTKVRMTIAPLTTMTITLYIGAVLSQSKALHKMAAKTAGNADYASSMLQTKAAAYGRTINM